MNFKLWHQALCATALAAAAIFPAQAALISFEGVAPGTIVFEGDTVTEQGYSVRAGDAAAVVDTSAAFGPGLSLDLAGPTGNASSFYIGLNDGFMQLRAVDGGAFSVYGFDFGFVSALTQLFNPGDRPGLMIAAFEETNGAFGGEAYSFGAADANGEFAFQSVSGAGLGALGGKSLRVVDFYACTADANGGCAPVNFNFSQFAIDNINVPEPGSLALVLAALALTAGIGARRPKAC